MKKLLSCIAALFTIFSIVSCLQEERSPEEILVPSPAEVDCSESFSITSKVPKGSEKLVEECGFLVGTTKDLADALTVEGSMTENTFSAALPARKYGTTYYICSYVTNGRGSEIRSDLISYELKSLEEYVSFGKIKLLSYNPLTKLAEITIPAEIQPGVNVTEVGVCYGSSESLSDEDTYVEGTISEDGTITVSLEGFKDGTQYYMRPYIKENEYIAYASTSPFLIPTVPVVITYPAEEITSESAVLSAEVERGDNITERGFVWLNGQGTPTIDSYKLKIDGTLGKFTATLSDLDANARYAYRAYVVNDQGVFYGDILTFTTIAGAASLSSIRVTNITTTTAMFTCTVTSHGGETVSEVGFYYSTEESVDIETAHKISEVYSTDAFTLKAEGLEVGQIYYVKAYAKNSLGEVYSAAIPFKTISTTPSVSTVGHTKLSATSAELSGDVADDNGEAITERGFVWIRGTGTPTTSSSKVSVEGTVGEYTAIITGLEPNQTYSYRAYAINSVGTTYGDVMQLKIDVMLPTVTTNDVTGITSTTATSGGVITSDGGGEILAKGVVWSRSKNPTVENSFKTEDGNGLDPFTSYLTDLISGGRTYYVRAYATNAVGTAYGAQQEFKTIGESPFEAMEPANCFIVSESGTYVFEAVKGNSSELVGSVASAEVLWESYGTSVIPEVGSLVSNVSVEGDCIDFLVPEPYHEGNAVIAAKDAFGTILWSWHIWLTDQPKEQVYYNNAGTMMDRNLGATNATPGEVGALGLLYQWGRKDPFLGSSSISSVVEAKSTLTWPSAVSSDSSTGNVDYVTAHPTTYVYGIESNKFDWHYSSPDNTLWKSAKTIYDPCPAGWRVPDGGETGVWSIAKGSSSQYTKGCDSTNEGMNFSGNFGSSSTIWYPASGLRGMVDGVLDNVGEVGSYWSVSTYVSDAYKFSFVNLLLGFVYPSISENRAYGFPVRCLKEGTGADMPQEGTDGEAQYDNDFSTSGAHSLSDAGTANSYIVSETGTYSIAAVKGNSSKSVGSVVSAEVLWETFGTEDKISKGSLVSGAKYENGQIYFKTSDTYREGNAVIAAKDASGTILWSWHIWLTDQPKEQVYYNNAGIMMDRNLGATSATPGDVGALGLHYQWGRKDPFLGSSSTSSNVVAKSTIVWPSAESSNSSNGTIDYATEHPTTFIGNGVGNCDWYYTGSGSQDNTRWQSEKTIYDPCPSGWRVPDGGSNGVWSKSFGSLSSFTDQSLSDVTNGGMNFSDKIGSANTIWYPASGCCSNNGGSLVNLGSRGYYWSVSSGSNCVYTLFFIVGGSVSPWSDEFLLASGRSVRCFKEYSGGDLSEEGTDGGSQYDNDFLISGARSLSDAGTANSYIVSSAGTYSIPAVKGNSSESVGSVASAEVLWETFGTDEKISKGSLVSGAKYENGKIYFKTADSYHEGNAVIAAKDASGTILWSWHIWLTDKPQEHIYNNAGTMMDRNLGATSATPGDVGALGLFYQWGRKDPFLGSSSISSNTLAKSSLVWPSAVLSNSSNGTISYATEHPTTFIIENDNNYDWYYTGSDLTDNTRWQSEKTIYDPCPTGWRVPDGGENGVWSSTLGSSSSYKRSHDSTNKGMNFSGDFGNYEIIWYPASGDLRGDSANLRFVALYGYYWSCSPDQSKSYNVYSLNFTDGRVEPIGSKCRGAGSSVRCLKE